MTTINILFYTDHQSVSLADESVLLYPHRVSILGNLMQTRGPAFARLNVSLVNRFEVPDSPKKITEKLLQDIHEIWFFGKHQTKYPEPFHPKHGGPENELDPTEQSLLEEWMKSGGVLVSGDHAEIDPTLGSSDPATFKCLGRALGRFVPRAGELRKWEGPPTNLPNTDFSTLVKVGSTYDEVLQGDDTPQALDLVAFGPNGSPHPLFLGKRKTIKIFPDHAHEGLVIIPTKLDGKWLPPGGGNPQAPIVVAFAFDKRIEPSRRGEAIAVYDGDPVGFGRIVSDSSWHHYFNVNLANLNDTGEDSTLDLMAQFYSNLAIWLAPLSLRQEMSKAMFEWAASYPEVEEETGNSPLRLGKVALRYLSRMATHCEITALIELALPGNFRMDNQPFVFLTLNAPPSPMPPLELALGSIINQYHRAGLRVGDVGDADASDTPEEMISRGIMQAFRLHADELNRISSEAGNTLENYLAASKLSEG